MVHRQVPPSEKGRQDAEPTNTQARALSPRGGSSAPQRRGLHADVVERLGSRIVSGELSDAAPLDPDHLETELGVSRTVVREALRVLAAKGLVEARPRRGTTVRPRPDWNLFDSDVLRWEFEGRATVGLLHNLDEVRLIIEPAIAGLAAERRTDADLVAIDTALAAMRQAADDHAASAAAADVAFHRALAHASHNDLLIPIQEVILVGLRARDIVVHRAPRGTEAIALHADVLAAVRDGTPETAQEAMRTLLALAVKDTEEVTSADRRNRRGARLVDY